MLRFLDSSTAKRSLQRLNPTRGTLCKQAFFLIGILLLGAGCSPSITPAKPTTANSTQHPSHTKVPITVVTATDAGTPAELFERAKKLFVEEKYQPAAELFDLVHRGEPEGNLAPMALLQAGGSYQAANLYDLALNRYSTLVEQYSKEPLVKVALIHKVRLLIEMEKWPELSTALDGLLSRADLSVSDSIEAQGGKGLALVETGQTDQGSRFIDRARNVMEKYHIGESGRIPPEVAQVYFALGEARRIKSERIGFDPPPANFGEAFEGRAQGLLDAQAAYTDAMRSTDLRWATMAGYRVGKLYQQLHADVMVAKAPAAMVKTAKDRQLFEGAMRLRYRILLEKGLKMMNSTVHLTERTGEESLWITRAKEAKADLERAITEENTALAKLPYSESELRKTLDDLQAKRDAEKSKTTPP